MPDSVCHVVGSGSSINNVDYVTGIGNSSHEQNVHTGNPCRIDLPKKTHKNAPKLTKMAKNQVFFKYFRQYLPNKNT